MKKMFGIMLMLLVLGLLCGVASANDKCSDYPDWAPSMVMIEVTVDTVIDVVLVALGTEQPVGTVAGAAVLKEDLQCFEKGIGQLTDIACAFYGKTFVSTQPSAAISYLPDIGGSAV